MNLTLVVFANARDAGMLPAFASMALRTYPGATLVVAADDKEPFDTLGFPVVVNTWGTTGPVIAVPEALRAAAVLTHADWILKTDVDVAHLGSGWLSERRTHRMVGLSTETVPWVCCGISYAMDRGLVMQSAKGCPIDPPWMREEDVSATLRARHYAPGKVFTHRHDPRGTGLFATWNTNCNDVMKYVTRYDIVHCGAPGMARQDVVSLMLDFEEAHNEHRKPEVAKV